MIKYTFFIKEKEELSKIRIEVLNKLMISRIIINKKKTKNKSV